VTPEQADINDARAAELRKKLKSAGRTLSGPVIKCVREEIGLSQKDAAALFGGGEVAFSRYESESVAMSMSAETMLKMAYVWPDTLVKVNAVRSATTLAELDSLRGMRIHINEVVSQFSGDISVANVQRLEARHSWGKFFCRPKADSTRNHSARGDRMLEEYEPVIDVMPSEKVNHGKLSDKIGSNKYLAAAVLSD